MPEKRRKKRQVPLFTGPKITGQTLQVEMARNWLQVEPQLTSIFY